MRIQALDHPTVKKGAKELAHEKNAKSATDAEKDTGLAEMSLIEEAKASEEEHPLTELEELLVHKLTEGEPNGSQAEVEAVKRLPPRWEIRIQTERDPIAEETKAYRTMAKEVDDRYDK